MVDTSKCFSLIRGRAMRVTRLDGCGGIVRGPDSTVVSDGFITAGLTAQSDEGTEISVTNAAGRVCISDTPCPAFTGYEASIEFCNVNPDLFRLLTGQSMVFDATTPNPIGVGFRMNSGVNACDVGFALELWSNVPSAACDPAAGVAYGYFLIPFLKGGILGDFTIQNDAINFTLSGARSKDGSAWGVGPYNVVGGVGGAPSPLKTAIDDQDHLHLELTTVAPPTPACGAQQLGVPMIASPTAAWATGQYVTLRNGTRAKWSGTAWVAG
jgi:hypothetical protein